MGLWASEAFFALLRSGLYGTPVDVGAMTMPIDWQRVMELAEKHTVRGLVFDAVAQLPETLRPPKAVADEMLRLSLLIVRSHHLLDTSLARVVEFYRSNGIEMVVLKGQGVARCYRNPQLRQCGDIDLYVGKKAYRHSVELAQRHLDAGEKKPTESVKHYHFDIGRVSVELHRIAAEMHTPYLRGSLERWMATELGDKDRLAQLDINGTTVWVPSADFNAFFIFYHAWYHFYKGGIGLRQLCDWVMVLHQHKDDIDREALNRRLQRFGLTKAWQLFAHIAVQRLGLPPEEMPLYQEKKPERYDEVETMVMEGGNFGFYDSPLSQQQKRRMSFLKRKAYSLHRRWKYYLKTATITPMEGFCSFVKTFAAASGRTIKQIIRHDYSTQ